MNLEGRPEGAIVLTKAPSNDGCLVNHSPFQTCYLDSGPEFEGCFHTLLAVIQTLGVNSWLRRWVIPRYIPLLCLSIQGHSGLRPPPPPVPAKPAKSPGTTGLCPGSCTTGGTCHSGIMAFRTISLGDTNRTETTERGIQLRYL